MMLNTVLSVLLLAIVFWRSSSCCRTRRSPGPTSRSARSRQPSCSQSARPRSACYIGRSQIGSGFGAAGALIVLLVWIYYSSLIFLLGAEFTRAYTQLHGSHIGQRPASPQPGSAPAARPAAEHLPSWIRVTQVDIAHGANPALSNEVGRRPSLVQIAVATLAVLILPPTRRAVRDSASPASRKKPVHELGPMPK